MQMPFPRVSRAMGALGNAPSSHWALPRLLLPRDKALPTLTRALLPALPPRARGG